MEGTVQEWITSAADTRSRIWVLNGITVRLSTSSNRNSLIEISLDGSMYESNSTLGKSEYSYDQYHWWPIVLIVIAGVFTSSNKYKARRDGRAIKIRINAGMIVHTSSIIWPSYNLMLVNLLIIIVTRIYEIKDVIINRINIVWSWKKISCSIIGEAAFCKPRFLHKGIFKEVLPIDRF